MITELTKRDIEAFFDGIERNRRANDGKAGRYPAIDFPPHVTRLLGMIRARFAANTGGIQWDEYELMAYAPQCLRVRSSLDVDQLFIALRAKHTFRPSTAELRAAIDEMYHVQPAPDPLPGHVIESRRVFSVPERQLPAVEGDTASLIRSQLSALPGWSNSDRLTGEERVKASRRAHGHRV
jgi:hypothetical protein